MPYSVYKYVCIRIGHCLLLKNLANTSVVYLRVSSITNADNHQNDGELSLFLDGRAEHNFLSVKYQCKRECCNDCRCSNNS